MKTWMEVLTPKQRTHPTSEKYHVGLFQVVTIKLFHLGPSWYQCMVPSILSDLGGYRTHDHLIMTHSFVHTPPLNLPAGRALTSDWWVKSFKIIIFRSFIRAFVLWTGNLKKIFSQNYLRTSEKSMLFLHGVNIDLGNRTEMVLVGMGFWKL